MWTGISDSVETIRYTQFITVTKPNSLFKFSSAHKHFSVQEKNKIKFHFNYIAPKQKLSQDPCLNTYQWISSGSV